MLKKLLFSVALVLWGGYSYSESISPYYGYTPNAAINGHSWSMDNVLPEPPGLDINAVLYKYTPIKVTSDDMKVHVQNEDAVNGGYIFRETDDWSGKPGGIEIRKVVPVIPNIPRNYWGDGSIEVEGTGTVTEASVIYSYKVDPCFDPQYDPNCPGYQTPTPPKVEEVDLSTIYDATNGDAEIAEVDEELIEKEEEDEKSDEEKEAEAEEEEKDSKERLEKALAAADNSALFADALANSRMLDSMNAAVNFKSYETATINGGSYNDTVVLDGGNLPDNKAGRRMNFRSQILHDEMVDLQYNR